MWNLLKAAFFVFAGLVFSSSAFSAQLMYSHQFVNGVSYNPGSSQYDDWLSFRASLPTSDVTGITVSGSRRPSGRTCSDPVKSQQIADAMRAGASGLGVGVFTLSLSCDGFNWNTGSCSGFISDANNLELNVGSGVRMCSCNASNDTVRPGIAGGPGRNNANWGGIAGSTICGAQTQTMTVTVNFITDTDGDGVLDNDDFCPDNTVIPEGVPTMGDLNPNHWALTVIGNGFDFDTVTKGKGKGPNRSYTIEDTAGCSCEQIIEIQVLGDGHTKHGCSISAMDDWVDFVNP